MGNEQSGWINSLDNNLEFNDDLPHAMPLDQAVNTETRPLGGWILEKTEPFGKGPSLMERFARLGESTPKTHRRLAQYGINLLEGLHPGIGTGIIEINMPRTPVHYNKNNPPITLACTIAGGNSVYISSPRFKHVDGSSGRISNELGSEPAHVVIKDNLGEELIVVDVGRDMATQEFDLKRLTKDGEEVVAGSDPNWAIIRHAINALNTSMGVTLNGGRVSIQHDGNNEIITSIQRGEGQTVKGQERQEQIFTTGVHRLERS